MFCPFCGNQNRGGKRFCRQCGRTLPAPRPSVATSALSPTDEFANFIQESVSSLPAQPQPLSEPPAANGANGNNYHQGNHNHQPAPIPQPIVAIDNRVAESQNGNHEYLENNGNSGDLVDQLNQFTQQLLPDTVDFPVLQSPSDFPSDSPQPVNGHSNAYSAPVSQAGNADKGRDSWAGNNNDLHSAMSAAAFEDLHETTDEIDMLDKTMDRTAEVPLLNTAEVPVLSAPVKTEQPVQTVTRAVPSFLSVVDVADGSLPLEQSRRMERIIMSAALVLALTGIAFLIWIFF